MDGVITRQSEEYIMMMRMLKKSSKEILEFQDLPVPIAGEVYMTGTAFCGCSLTTIRLGVLIPVPKYLNMFLP